MADKFVEMDLEGEDELMLAFERADEKRQRWARRMLDNLADFGVHVLQGNVPVHSTYLLRHVARSTVTWHPGGTGGGGEYGAVMGVKAGSSRHPLYVEFGTGLYGAVGWYIVPLRAQFMVFYSSLAGKKIAVSKTRGQRPQRYFYTMWREMQIYAAGRIMSTDLLN